MRITLIASLCAILAPVSICHAQTVAPANLQRAKLCSISTTKAQVGHEGNNPSNWTINLSNDGGWCWHGTHARFGQAYAPTFRVTSPPAHGELAMGEVNPPRTRVAYRPAPGFVGKDTFTLTESIKGWQIIATVTVTQ